MPGTHKSSEEKELFGHQVIFAFPGEEWKSAEKYIMDSEKLAKPFGKQHEVSKGGLHAGLDQDTKPKNDKRRHVELGHAEVETTDRQRSDGHHETNLWQSVDDRSVLEEVKKD